jgi:phage-related protein
LLAVIDDTARNGPPANKTKFNFLTDGLYELKSWKLRLICFFDDNSIIVCTHGFFKRQQGTPDAEKERAKKMRTAYFEAKKRGHLHHVQPGPR